jgi:hypothetical protein
MLRQHLGDGLLTITRVSRSYGTKASCPREQKDKHCIGHRTHNHPLIRS